MARTDNLTNYLTDVATAIKNKKGDNTPIPASNFDTEITNLPSGGGVEIKDCSNLFYNEYRLDQKDEILSICNNATRGYGMFQDCQNITTLDLSGFNAKAMITINNMFSRCSKLKSLNLSHFITSNIKNMSGVFYGCLELETLNLDNWDTSKAGDMSYLFYNCRKLSEVNLSHFKSTKLTNVSGMFQGCNNLTKIDLSGFKESEINNMNSMFQGCSNLETLDLSNLDTSNVTYVQSLFYGCSKLSNLKMRFNVPYPLTSLPLTEESVNWILSNINETTTAKTLTLGDTNLAKATPEALAIAQSRGWTIQ